MIWELEIKLFQYDNENNWKVKVEIDSMSNLQDLHYLIQYAVDFDNDHLYEFFVSKTERSRDRIRFDDENEKIYSTTLESLYPLEKGKKLYYMFDYGDSWLFVISKSRKKPQEIQDGVKYPRIINEEGNKPDQYPEWEE